MDKLITLDKLTENFISDVRKADILPIDLMDKVENMLPELQHNLETQTIWRTETEIRCSVLNGKDFPDNAAKYHQAKLEQRVFFDQLLQLSFEYRDKQQDLFIIEADIEDLKEELADCTKTTTRNRLVAKIAKKEIEHQQTSHALKYMQLQGKDRVRELELWSKLRAELDDGSFDKDSKDTNQLISLTRRYIQEAFHAVNGRANTDLAGYNNILAQFFELSKECIARGIMDEVLGYFGNTPVKDWVINSFK